MKLPFGLGRNKDEEDEDSDKTRGSSLGLFSPAHGMDEQNPARDCKKLAELENIFIRSRKLTSLEEDVPFVVNQVRDGRIVLLDISRIHNNGKGKLELKRVVERIRGQTRGYNADIALVNDDCVIVTPSFVKF
ncbi:MAG: cell division protein SepF [Candidatus Thorarchaeota archaeon]